MTNENGVTKGKIYLLTGNTGEYSDYREWTVCAYTNRADAEAHMTLLDAMAKSVQMRSLEDYDARIKAEEEIRAAEHGDPDACIDYTGIGWHVDEVVLKSKL